MDEKKKRILFGGEASYLNTGFSNYYRELLPRLAATNKYELFEIGSYGHYSDPRWHELVANRWKFYGVMPESDEEARAFQQADNHPRAKGQNLNQFGKGKFEQVVADCKPDIYVDIRDNWMAEWVHRSPFRSYLKFLWMPTVDSCFPANTKIVTRDGIRNIEDITTDDLVLTHDGTFQKVLKTFVNKNDQNLIEIRSCHNSLPVKMTWNHPVLTIRSKSDQWHGKDRIRKKEYHLVSDAKFINAKDIKAGDYVVVPPIKENVDVEVLDLAQFLTHDKIFNQDERHIWVRSTSQKINRFIPLNEDVLRFFGFYIAEGSTNYFTSQESGYGGGHIRISMNRQTEKEELKFCVDVLRKYFGLEANFVNRQADLGEDIQCSSVLISNIFSNLFGRDAYTKKVPSFIMTLPSYKIASLLEGAFFGDGSDTHTIHNKRTISYSTVSQELATQFFHLLLKIGCLSSLSLNDNSYKLDLLGQHARKLANYFHWDSLKEFADFDNSKSWIDQEGNAILRIRYVSEIDECPDRVYNFEVENNHTYVTSFIVHNCPQLEEWIRDYENCNMVMSYSDFGVDVLKRTSPKVKIWPTPMRPGVDLSTFKVVDKKQVRSEVWNLSNDIRVIGTVQRNQQRKLFPDLIDAFGLMKNKYKGEKAVDKAVLALHTSWPDNAYSYDYPRHIMRLQSGYYGCDPRTYYKGIKDDILNTFMCYDCGNIFLSWAANLWEQQIQEKYGAKKIFIPCNYCGKVAAATPDTSRGFSREQLASFYSCLDVYTQVSIAEGDGMPANEAKACCVPTLVMDHSAMAEKGRFPSEYIHLKNTKPEQYTVNKGGLTINVGRHYYEPETSQRRCLPDLDDLADKMRLLITNDELRETMSREARECVEENYDWDKLAKQWEYVLDNVKPIDRSTTWEKPYELQAIDQVKVPDGLTDDQYIDWLYLNVLKYDKVDDAGKANWLAGLINKQQTREQVLTFFQKVATSQIETENYRAKMLVATQQTENNVLRGELV